MPRKAKDILYFFVARYFRFFARIRLRAWNPRIVVVTGSNGKTTTLNLLQVQLGALARYSHGANSSFGIPFDILGLKRESYSPFEWFSLFVQAPLHAWSNTYTEGLYIVEADCDRPYEGDFLSRLLKPEVTVWLSCTRTHSMNFEKAAHEMRFRNVDQAIAHEFGFFPEHTSRLVIVNGDELLIMNELKRTRAEVKTLKESELLRTHKMGLSGSEFAIDGTTYAAPYLLPKETWYSIAASSAIAEYFNVEPKTDLSALLLPPGRSSVFRGVKNTMLIDSTYNANVGSVSAIVHMLKDIPAPVKWLVLGDLIEQGSQEKEEHEKVARLVASAGFSKILLVGPRLKRYALPLLPDAVSFEQPRAALDYIEHELHGGELLVFKGARFLEGVVEHLLLNKNDVQKLCRREAIWQKRRERWGL